MGEIYSIAAVVCVPSNRLITDENGEQFYECMTQEELERITQEKDKDTLKTYLFNALSMMDSTISTIATSIEKGLPIQVKIIFTIKDSLKGSVLNMDNQDLSVSEKIVLGAVTIGIGVATIYFELGIIASLIISYITTWLLTRIYTLLRDTTLYLWQEAKNLANSTWQDIMSLIESDERSLEARKEDMTNKIADEIFNLQEVSGENFIKNISQENHDDLIQLLCQQKTNAGDIHQYLECSHYLDRADSKHTESSQSDTPLHTAPNTIPIRLQAQCINHNNEPLANKEIYAFSMDIGHFVERVLSDDKGIIECNNILVYNNGSLSQVYFVLRQLGLDEEQKITHIQISPRLDISPAYKKQGSLEGIKTLHFAKDIPKHIAQHDKINAKVRVSAIYKIDTIQAHNTTQLAIPLSLKAKYIIKGKTKDTKEAQSLIAQYRHNTKWGYIVFEKHQDIHKELQKQGIMLSPTQLNTQGESLSIPIKKDWEGKNIAIFAYLKTPSKSVRYDIKHYRAMPLSLQYTGKSLDLLSYGQILKSYKLSQTKNEYMRRHGHIELEQGVDTNAKSLDIGTYMIAKTDIQSALIPTSNKHRIDTPHLVKEFSPLAFECMNDKKRFYISYNANHNNLNLIEYESLQRPINLKSPQIKKHIKIFLESRELFEDLAHIHTTMQHKGINILVLEVVYVEVEKPYYIDSEGYLQGLGIVKYPITRLELSLANGFMPKAIVLHMTDSNTAKSSLESWNNPNNARVGTHFLIDTDGTIYQCASLHKYTQHVGDIRSKVELEKTWNTQEKALIESIWKEKTSYSARKIKVSNYEKSKSYPNRYPINSDSIGIEVVGKYDNKTKRYPNATTKQLESLEQLVAVLLELFNMNKANIYAHAKIAYKDENSTEGVSLLEHIETKL